MYCQAEEDRRYSFTRRSPGFSRSEVIAGWYDEFSGILLSYLARLTRSIHEAEDIAQEAFLRVMVVSEPIVNPKALLFATATNLVRDHSRRAHTHAMRAAVSLEDVEIPDSCEPSQVIESEQALRQVVDTLDQLHSSTRKAFLLSRVEMHSNQKIAARMGVTVSMVEKHIRYAIDAFETIGFKLPRHAAGRRAAVVRGRARRTKRPIAAGYAYLRVPVAAARKRAGMPRRGTPLVIPQLAMFRSRSAMSKCLRGYGLANVALSGL